MDHLRTKCVKGFMNKRNSVINFISRLYASTFEILAKRTLTDIASFELFLMWKRRDLPKNRDGTL